MDKKEYIVRQLRRTYNKKYEAYVVHRIIHLLNDLDIKFVTQQYVVRPDDGIALTDLFFPQINLHIEVDEGHHKANIDADKLREFDIINTTGYDILRVDVTVSIEQINQRINEVLKEIHKKIDRLKNNSEFKPWSIDSEFNSDTFIKLGYIDIHDNVAFKTIKDACNCFGHNYIGYQKAGASHPDSTIMLWFPKLFPNGEWDNQISDDEKTITEKSLNTKKVKKHIIGIINREDNAKHKRIVFAKVKGNLGFVLYRFRGLYKLDFNKSGSNGLVWRRIATKVKTFPKPKNNS